MRYLAPLIALIAAAGCYRTTTSTEEATKAEFGQYQECVNGCYGRFLSRLPDGAATLRDAYDINYAICQDLCRTTPKPPVPKPQAVTPIPAPSQPGQP